MPIALSDISFVIITNRPTITTTSSIPPESETIIVDGTHKRGTAHNYGINQATRPYIAICDDDIVFDSTFLEYITSHASPTRIIGLQAYYPSPFLISRFMLFHISAFNKIGNFEECNHGFETEWLIRSIKNNYSLFTLDRKSVIHLPHPKDKPPSGEGSNIIWLLKKHPNLLTYILKIIWNKLRKSSLDEEYI